MAVLIKFLVPKLIVAVDKNCDLNIEVVLQTGTGKNRTEMDVSYNM